MRSNTVAVSKISLLNTWKLASKTEECIFYFLSLNLNNHISIILDSIAKDNSRDREITKPTSIAY